MCAPVFWSCCSLVIELASPSSHSDNSKKAYYREFKKVIEAADVILEVLDARDPIGCRSKQVEEMILNAGADKKIILVLNKIDLVPREVVEKWMKFLRNEFPAVAFKGISPPLFLSKTVRSSIRQHCECSLDTVAEAQHWTVHSGDKHCLRERAQQQRVSGS